MNWWRRTNLEARWGAFLVLVILALGLLVPIISPFDQDASVAESLLAPNLTHPFGTDQLGRDIFVRAFAAARLDISLALISVAIPLVIGTAIGSLAGTTTSPVVDIVWSVIVEAINALPFIVLAIAILSILGAGTTSVIAALALTNWARYARLTRAKALALRTAPFVEATRVLGYSRFRILSRHIVPNVIGESLAYGLSDFVIVIVVVSGLSFIGLGVQPPTPEWGSMMADGRLFLQTHPWLIIAPGVVLSTTAIAVAMLAQGLLRSARGEN
jgi:peptide/nickel transport system permease protein